MLRSLYIQLFQKQTNSHLNKIVEIKSGVVMLCMLLPISNLSIKGETFKCRRHDGRP
jgi:hypothetical protein